MRLLAVLILAGMQFASSAATLTAASASQADVASKEAEMADGDTLVIPSGDVTWASAVTFDKVNIVIQGAGTNSGGTLTKLTRTTAGDIFTMAPASSGHIRIKGIFFSGGSYSASRDTKMIHFTRTNNATRIDHCHFEYGKRVLHFERTTWGVIDHCTFKDNDLTIAPSAEADTAETSNGDIEWGRSIMAAHGTTNTMVGEDLAFVRSSGTGADANEILYGQVAGTFTLRNFTVNSAMTDFNFVDAHGYPNGEDFGGRGTHGWEIYDGTLSLTSAYRLFNLRGGQHLIHDLTFTGPASVPDFDLRDEGVLCCGTPTSQDYITNTHIWNVTYNGSTYALDVVNPTQIVENTHYFLRAPQSGDAVTYPYNELVYPHPRVTAEDGAATPAIQISGGVQISGSVTLN
jgi:hypothetical protein